MGLIFVVYTLAAADRANIGIVLPFVKAEFNMTNTEAGALISLFFIGYSLAQIPSGFLVKRFGVRAVFPLFMVLTSAFTALLGTASSALHMKLNRLALGLAEAPLPVSMLSTINRWFPSVEKGTAVGIFLAGAKFGPVLVPPLGALVIASFGWQYVFYICATPGVLLAIAWYVLVANDPAQSRFTSPAEVQHIRSEATPLFLAQTEDLPKPIGQPDDGRFRWLDRIIRGRVVRPISTTAETFKSPNIWGLAIAYLLMTGIINVILAWLPTYLTTVKQLSILNVGFVASAPFIGAVLGNLLGGLFSDRVVGKRRKPTIIITTLSSVFMMYALIHAPNQPLALAVLLFFTGLLLNLGYSSFTVYPAGLTTKEAYPLAVSVVNTGGQAGGAALPFITGLLLDAYSWDAVFLFLAASSLVALAVIAFVVEPLEGGDERTPA
jgi:sugar phosphate permease